MIAREKIYAAISNAYYDARNDGRTMTDAAEDATDRVVELIVSGEVNR